MSRCARCGAALPVLSTWCGQCFTPVHPDSRPEAHDPVGEPHETVAYTRWRKTETSFGPLGRIVLTVLVLLMAAFTAVSGNPFAMIAWALMGAPVVLRSVWARQRIT